MILKNLVVLINLGYRWQVYSPECQDNNRVKYLKRKKGHFLPLTLFKIIYVIVVVEHVAQLITEEENTREEHAIKHGMSSRTLSLTESKLNLGIPGPRRRGHSPVVICHGKIGLV